MKLYFSDIEPESCYSLDYFEKLIKEEGLDEIVLTEAIADKSKDYFYCKFYDESGIKNESACGRNCEAYTPRNKIKGICKYHSHCYQPGEKKFILNKNRILRWKK